VRKYARWLLNHADEVQQTHGRSQLRSYGPEVQHVLFLAWHAANRICAKRLIPFLPTLIEALERHEHLHISEECRRQLLSMSAATADCLLSSQRKLSQRGLSTTRAGTLLKQQIPIRTIEEWNEARPGFLEADLVAHCGTDIEGGYLYTLTLTDVATGWTECLPLLSRSQETVLAALQRARTLFPFPILGIDTDNSGEFINETLIVYRGLLGSPKKFTMLVSSQTISPAWRFPPITGAGAPHYKKGLTTFSERSSRSISR